MRPMPPQVWLVLALQGCAMSPIVDAPFDASREDADAEVEPAIESDDEVPEGATDDGDEGDEQSDDGDNVEDAGPPVVDASAAVRDAGRKEDAATDAGRDAGRARPTVPTSRAGEAVGEIIADIRGRCQTSAECTQSCVPIGILSCCRADKTCGCTWAPGAYCL